MINLRKIIIVRPPAMMGLGLAWIGVRILTTEIHATADMEIRLQLDATGMKGP